MKPRQLAINLCAASFLAGSFAYANTSAGGDVNPGSTNPHYPKHSIPIGQPTLDPETGSMGQLNYRNTDWGFFIDSPNKDFSIGAYGYVQGDAAQFFGGSSQDIRSGTHLHRAKLEMSGTVMHDWGWAIHYDFMSSAFYKGYITYRGWQNMELSAGQTGPDFSMASIMSSNRLTFLETPLPVAAFAPGYYEGIYYKYFRQHFSASASLFGPAYTAQTHGRTPLGAAVRFAYSPINTLGRVFAIAADELIQRPDGSKNVYFYTPPEVSLHKDYDKTTGLAYNDPTIDLIYTGVINNTKHYNLNDLEMGGVYNSWSVQGEAINNHVSRDSGSPDVNFFGYYVLASYFLTGESVTYNMKDGDFSDISPINHSYGAFQLAAQYSNLNLTSEDIKGGKENNSTFGVNWYINKYVTLKLDVMHINYKLPVTSKSGSTNAVMSRIQLKF